MALTNLRRTPDADGNDFIVLAADDERLVRHSTYEDALEAAQSLSFKSPGKKFRVFAALADIHSEAVRYEPNTTIYFASKHDTLLVAVETDRAGELRTGVVGTADGKAFSITPSWLATRNDLSRIGREHAVAPKFVPHLIAMVNLMVRENRLAGLVAKGAA
jgi:hypothetical protein